MKNNLPKIISWIVVIGLIFAFTLYISYKEKKANEKEQFKDLVWQKYQIFPDDSYDYYRGFEAGIEWAKDNPESVVGGSIYIDDIRMKGYDDGYDSGYDSAKSDYEAEIFSMQLDFNKEKAKAEEQAYDKGYEEGKKYGIYITDPQNRADYLDRYQEGYNDGYEDGVAGKPMWQGF